MLKRSSCIRHPGAASRRETPRHPRSTAVLAASPRRHPRRRSPAREAAGGPGPDHSRAPRRQSPKKVQPRRSPRRGFGSMSLPLFLSPDEGWRSVCFHDSALADSPIPPVPSPYGDASAQGQSFKDEEPWKAGATWSTGRQRPQQAESKQGRPSTQSLPPQLPHPAPCAGRFFFGPCHRRRLVRPRRAAAHRHGAARCCEPGTAPARGGKRPGTLIGTS